MTIDLSGRDRPGKCFGKVLPEPDCALILQEQTWGRLTSIRTILLRLARNNTLEATVLHETTQTHTDNFNPTEIDITEAH